MKSEKLLKEFTEYCEKNTVQFNTATWDLASEFNTTTYTYTVTTAEYYQVKELRFWQALRNWSNSNYLISARYRDQQSGSWSGNYTFYWYNRNEND